MLCDLGLSAETQTQLYRKSSRKPSPPLVRRLFLAEFLSHNLGPVLIASSIDWSKGKATQGTSAEYGARRKTTLLGGTSYMLLKKDRPFFFTDKQTEQLRRSNGTLRQLNRDARRELGGIGALLTDKQYRDAGLWLGNLAIRMISVLRLREGVLNSGRQQQPTHFEVVFGSVCENCSMPSHNPENAPNSHQPPEVDPAHLPELDSVVEIAYDVGERVWLWFEPKTPPKACLVGLKRLADALLKQRRHLEDIAPNPTFREIKVIHDQSETCSDCHKPFKNTIESDDPNELTYENDLKN